LDEAARLMRDVYTRRDEAETRGKRAARDLALRHSAVVAGRTAAERLEQIRRRRALLEPARTAALLRERLHFLREAERAIVRALDDQKELS
jgi:hypothetical protein